MKEIGLLFNCTENVIKRWLKELEISIKTISEISIGREPSNKIKCPYTKEELFNLYYTQNLSANTISKINKIDASVISRWLRDLNIKIKNASEAKMGQPVPKYKCLISRENLYDLCCTQCKPIKEIANIFNVSSQVMTRWLSEYNISHGHKKYFGKNHHNYIDGQSIKYCHKFNNKLKIKIRNRDNNICQLCNKTEEQEGHKMSVHHIHYDKENCNPDLITLCRSCNVKVNKYRDYWEQYFMRQLAYRKLTKNYNLNEMGIENYE